MSNTIAWVSFLDCSSVQYIDRESEIFWFKKLVYNRFMVFFSNTTECIYPVVVYKKILTFCVCGVLVAGMVGVVGVRGIGWKVTITSVSKKSMMWSYYQQNFEMPYIKCKQEILYVDGWPHISVSLVYMKLLGIESKLYHFIW